MISLNNKNKLFFISLITLSITIIVLCNGCSSKSNDEKFAEKIKSAEEYKKKEKFPEARIDLQSAIDLKPENAEAYYQLAEVLLRLSEYARALENYNSAINYDPKHILARVHLASIQIIAKQYEQAENNINAVLELEPQNEEARILKANLVSSGPRRNVKEAKSILLDVLSKNPNSVPALGSLGHLELSDEQRNTKDKTSGEKLAEEYFLKALAIDPKNQAVHMALADLYSRQGRLDEAQTALSELVNKNPEQSGLRYVLGEFFLRRGLNDKALEQYEQIIEKDPKRSEARDRLYDMYLARQENEKAKTLASDLEKKLSNDKLIPYFQGRNEEINGNLDKALVLYLQAISNDSTFSPAFRKAGTIEIAKGKVTEGIEHLTQSISIDPGDVGARLTLAKTNMLRGNVNQAKEHVEQVLQRFPKQLGANIIRADIALIEGDVDRARYVYEFLTQNYPNVPVGYYKLAMLEEKSKNFDKAIELYEKVLTFDEGVLAPGRRLVLCLNEQKKPSSEMISKINTYRENSKKSKAEYDVLIGSILIADPGIPNRIELAKEKFNSALKENPNLIGAYFALGGLDAMGGDTKAAIENYKKLLEQDPNHIPTRMLLALNYERENNYSEAAESYKKILDKSPRFAPAANNLAYIFSEHLKGSDLNEALRLAEIAKEELPRESSVADTLAWVHYKKGNPRAALPILLEAVKIEKEQEPTQGINPEILYHLALVQKDTGDKSEAKKTINLAIEKAGPKYPLLEEMKKFANSF